MGTMLDRVGGYFTLMHLEGMRLEKAAAETFMFILRAYIEQGKLFHIWYSGRSGCNPQHQVCTHAGCNSVLLCMRKAQFSASVYA